MKFPSPRDFQQLALTKISQIKSGKIVVYAPTGGGKAMLLMYLAEKYIKENKSVVLLVDRIVLTQQLSETASKYELKPNVYCGDIRISNNSKFTIASVQTFFAREVLKIKHYDVVLIDECHTMYIKQIAYIQLHTGLVIGVSATPFTIGMGNVYEEIINSTTPHNLTDKGILCPLEVITFQKIDMVNAKTIAGEWTGKEVENRSADILGNVVEGYIRNALGKRAICFCATIKHCNDMRDEFIRKGISCDVYTSKSTSEQRAIMLAKFDKDEIKILISVACLSKGFDKHYVECIIDVRPLRRSFAEVIQMYGRGLRSWKHKTKCILLDFTGNFIRFLPEYEELYYNGVKSLNEESRLQRIRKNRENIRDYHCPRCSSKPFHNKCIKCGYEALPTRIITTDTRDIVQLPVKIKSRGIIQTFSQVLTSLFR